MSAFDPDERYDLDSIARERFNDWAADTKVNCTFCREGDVFYQDPQTGVIDGEACEKCEGTGYVPYTQWLGGQA